jgi:hypothetical protein
MKMLQKYLVLICLLLIGNNVFAQTDSLYEDGVIYLKVQNTSTIVLNDFNGNTASLRPEFIPLQSSYSITSIKRPFMQSSSIDLQKTYEIKFSNVNGTNALLASLQALSYAQYAEKVPKHFVSLTPNDPLPNFASYNAYNYNIKKVSLENAWNVTTGSSNIIIAVIDNEIQMNHPDIAGNLWINPNETLNGIDDDGNGIVDDINGADLADIDNNTSPSMSVSPFSPILSLDHGTHVSGIAAARTGNSIGIAGAGFNCRLMPLKAALNSTTMLNTTAIINAVIYATNKGAHVINMSLGGPAFNQTFQNAINTANTANIVVVAAAGNSNQITLSFPAAYANVIAVAATNSNDTKANFSNFGAWIDVCAPGVQIYSTAPTSQLNLPNNGYSFKSGTSFAAPLVAGVCGLIRTVNPTYTPAQVLACLQNTATNINAINQNFVGQLGAGRINAHLAVQCAAGGAAPAISLTANKPSGCTGSLFTLTASSTFTNANVTYTWAITPAPATITFNNNTQSVAAVTFANQGNVNITLTAWAGLTQLGSFTQNSLINVQNANLAFFDYASSSICNGSMQMLTASLNNVTLPINFGITNPSAAAYTIAGHNDFNINYHFIADINNPNYILNVTDFDGCVSTHTIAITNIENCCAQKVINPSFNNGLNGGFSFGSDNDLLCVFGTNLMPFGIACIKDVPTIAPNFTLPNGCVFLPFGLGPNNLDAQADNLHNIYLGLDGRCSNQEVNQTFPNLTLLVPTPFPTPCVNTNNFSRLWFQSNINISTGLDYNIDYFIKSNGGQNGTNIPAIVRLRVLEQTNPNNVLFSSNNIVVANSENWGQISHNWVSNFSGNVTLQIEQVSNFSSIGYEFAIDDITLTEKIKSQCQFLSAASTINATMNPNPNNYYSSNNSLIINSNKTWTNIDIAMLNNPNAEIIVNSPNVLTLDNSRIHSCGNTLWKGIKVMPGARLILKNNSLIEDANIAVLAQNPVQNGTNEILDIQNTIFNKNNEGVVIEGFTPNNASAYPFVMYNTVFTCRELGILNCNVTPPNWFTAGNLTQTTTVADNLETPFKLQNLPFTNLRNNSPRSVNHLRLTNVGYTSGAINTPTIRSFSLRGPGVNPDLANLVIFDNAWQAILLQNANAKISGAVIQNCDIGIDAQATIGALKGAGQTPYSSLMVEHTGLNNKNRFFSNGRASIRVKDYTYLNISNNDFRSLQKSLNAPQHLNLSTYPTTNNNSEGKAAIVVNSKILSSANILSNSIHNNYLGINLITYAKQSPNSLNAIHFYGNIDINGNTIWNRPPANTTNDRFVSDAIVCSHNVTGSTNNPALSGTLQIRNNNIQNTYRGIEARGYRSATGSLTTRDNTITLLEDANSSALNIMHGIWHSFSTNVYCRGNTITGLQPNQSVTLGGTINSPSGRRQSNYRFDNNNNLMVTCNKSLRGWFGFEFNGAAASVSTQFINGNDIGDVNNQGGTHYVGYLLNNGGQIGPQPAFVNNAPSTQPWGNRFLFTVPTGSTTAAQTLTFNANAANSRINVSNVSPNSMPAVNLQSAGLPLWFYNPNPGPGQSIFSLNVTNSLTCASMTPYPFNTNTVCPSCSTQIANLGGTMGNELQYMARAYTYYQQKDVSGYQTYGTDFTSFYNSANAPTSVYRQGLDIETEIINGNFTNAQSLINSYPTTNRAESNNKS